MVLRFPNNIKGILWMVMMCLSDTMVITLVRFVTTGLSFYQFIFLSNAAALILFSGPLIKIGIAKLKTRKTILYALRGLLETLGNVLWYKAIINLPITEVTALSYLTPLLISAGATLFLGEKNRAYRWLALLTGFIGAIIVIGPGYEINGLVNTAAALALGSAVCFAICGIIVKILSEDEPPANIVFYMFLFTALFSLPLYFLEPMQAPLRSCLPIILLMAVSILLVQISVAKAFSATALTIIMPFSFLGLVFVAAAGYIFFSEIPQISTLAGGTIILAGVIASAFYEGKRARKVFK